MDSAPGFEGSIPQSQSQNEAEQSQVGIVVRGRTYAAPPLAFERGGEIEVVAWRNRRAPVDAPLRFEDRQQIVVRRRSRCRKRRGQVQVLARGQRRLAL